MINCDRTRFVNEVHCVLGSVRRENRKKYFNVWGSR
uniref:Uncharacterized protein n=1 Tax=Anguilla anguilla TaxID=7936 RepID=A0A0E9VDX6_ANGAN